jgi:AraC-like DNA-binding protein
VRSFPLDHASPSLGAVVFLIAESTIHELFSHLPGSDSAAGAILNDRGEVITAWGNRRSAAELSAMEIPPDDPARGGFFDRAIGGVPSIVAWNLSERGELVHVAAIPVSVVLSRIAHVRVLAAVLIAGFVAAGVAAGVVLARTNTRPYSELVEANDRLANVLHETRPQLRASLLNRLMRGGFQDERELRAFLPDAGLPESDTGYRMIVARVSGYRSVVSQRMAAEVNAHRRALLDGLQGRLPASDLAFTFGDDTVYILHAVSDRDRERDESAVELIAGIIRAIACDKSIRVAAGAGEPVRSLVDLRRSVDEALEVTEYLELGGDAGVTLFSRLPAARTGTYFYPLDVQARLENAVRSGHREHLAALLLEIRRKNFAERALSAPMIRQLLSDMRGTYLRIAGGRIGAGEDPEQEPVGLDLFSGPHETNPPELEVLAGAFERLTDCFHARKRSHNDVLWEKILRHVDENVHRAELCVTSASDAIGLNEDYFSRFFREQAGITFSHYVETRRLEQAERLLRLTDLSIDDITAKCGYATSRTFRRAFKRRHGVSPSEARAL